MAKAQAKIGRERRGRRETATVSAYNRVLRWMSLHRPTAWRLRLDILFVCYLLLFFGAVLTPALFAPLSGPKDMSSRCMDYRWDRLVEDFPVLATKFDLSNGDYDRNPAEYDRQFDRLYSTVPLDQLYSSRVSSAVVEGFSASPRSWIYPCAGIGSGSVWTKGFSSSEQSVVLLVFGGIAAIVGLAWAFFVARATRLQDVTRRIDSPGFALCVLALAPLVLLPLLAGHVAFAASHDPLLSAVILGKAEPFYFGGSETFSLLFLLFAAAALLIVVSATKIIAYDGILGGLRTILISSFVGLLIVYSTAFLLSLSAIDTSGTQTIMVVGALVSTIPTGLVWLLYKKDIWRGVRQRGTRTTAFVFSVIWPFVFTWYATALFGAFVQPQLTYGTLVTNHPVTLAYFATAFTIGVLVVARIFTDIARISLLPRPS